MSESLQRTPLHAFHTRHGARLVPFAGWEMPVQYTSIMEEHLAVRQTAGLFDVSHMGEVEVSGPQASGFLNYLVTNDVDTLKIGRGLYTVMCYEDGGVVDDLIIYRTGPELFFLCINAGNTEKDVEWIETQAVGFDCEVRHVSAAYAQIALQGPQAMTILQNTFNDFQAADLPRFHIRDYTFGEFNLRISRTGYTGEDGVEIYCPPPQAEALCEKLLTAGKETGLSLCGLGARDSLRLEAGYPLYGHEISSTIHPLEAGLGWVVKLQKTHDFIGKSALQSFRDAGIEYKVVFFRLEGRRIARASEKIWLGQNEVGEVLSGTFSPVTQAPIGSARIHVDALNQKDPVCVDLRGNRIALDIARPPLHQNGKHL